MSAESISIAGILSISWIIILILDIAASLSLSLVAGLSFRKIFLWGLTSLALPPVLILYGTLIERNIFHVSNVELYFEGLPESFDGYRIVHISDIHARSFQRRTEALRKAVSRINSTNGDIVVFTGDLITMNTEELDGLAEVLSEIKANDGVVSILGNHDYCIYDDPDRDGNNRKDSVCNLIEIEESMGWRVLLDENLTIRRGNDSIAVIGVRNISPSRHFPSDGDLQKASEGTEDMFRILLTHDPMHWDMEVSGKHYPLTLSGHTHGMQFSIFGWSPGSLIFRQDRGLYERNGEYLYINKGLGETIFPARIGAVPEITLITLHPSPDTQL